MATHGEEEQLALISRLFLGGVIVIRDAMNGRGSETADEDAEPIDPDTPPLESGRSRRGAPAAAPPVSARENAAWAWLAATCFEQ
jgi:hypothetical protein